MADVFVFGTNARGFHGAGAAGFAMLGIHGNKWSTTKVPGTDKYLDQVPDGTKGVLAVKGQAIGLMEGTKGFSYGIMTVTKPGARRSVPIDKIEGQLSALAAFAAEHPEHTFHLTAIGTGYAGYTIEEINMACSRARVWEQPNIRPCNNFNINNS